MKRKAAAALALLMTVSMLAGCGSDGGDKGKKSDGKTTLTFWCHQNEPWVKSYEAMAEKFEKEHPEYTVEVQDYPYDVYNEKIQTAITSDTAGPDIIAVWGGMAPNFIGTDALSEVPEDLAKELDKDYMAPTVGSYKKNGKYYGVPMEYNLEYGGMIVNKKLFHENGVAYPTTWEELRDVSKSVSVKNGDIVEMKGFEMFDTDSLICNYLAMILQTGGQYLEEDDSVNFATPEGVAAMEEILSMIKNGECDLTHLTDGDYCFNDVYQDKGYMASVGSWAIGEGTGTYELEYGTDFEYVRVPQYGDQMSFASETGWGLIVPENGKNKDTAWEFISFFSEPENLVEHNIACSQLPPRKSLLTNETYIEKMPHVEFLLDILPNGQWMGPYNTSDMREVLNQTFLNLCQEENPDVEGALKEASQKITSECKYGYSAE
ncbi:ABC transporter substrate-binding protein [Sellimonas intestinalis]|uniref:ABC transporter substrate-binding protein n=1 Tax=Sellimonas intestinalis TaxID=1653434 RepID=UPI0015EC9F90|nr:ABC transporter substrate-binding protein [Sellimonas intestinalis]MBA2214991.1 ABC transporter substrate-binding protein [Sellimonas intestinalis]